MPLKSKPRYYTKRSKSTGMRRYKKAQPYAASVLQASVRRLLAKQKATSSMIETKEAQYKSYPNTSLPQNYVYVVKTDLAQVSPLNPFITISSTGDPSAQNSGARIGDQISVKGLKIVAFFENALKRPKVFYRIMLIRCAKGDTIDRTTLFKNDSDNKMIDVVNNERFTILAQKRFNIYGQGAFSADSVNIAGEPGTTNVTGGGVGTKIINMWIPGRRFGKYGRVQYENGSTTQVKFYDYRVVILAYDWYGTPQDGNNVGKLNELYTKLYFKDA